MKRIILTALLCTLVGSGCLLGAQEKAKTENSEKKPETRPGVIPLRVQVIVSEYEGDKKISSLPYTLLMNAEVHGRGSKASLRMGLRVPVPMGSGPSTQFQYVDVGTNLDGWAGEWDDGRFMFHLSIERSSAYSSRSDGKSAPLGANETLTAQPVLQQFKSEVDFFIRDGQTLQSTLATDPVSGRVTKVEVTVTVPK